MPLLKQEQYSVENVSAICLETKSLPECRQDSLNSHAINEVVALHVEASQLPGSEQYSIQQHMKDVQESVGEGSSSMFDIFPPNIINPSFTSILDEIDLDLECEDDEVRCEGKVKNLFLARNEKKVIKNVDKTIDTTGSSWKEGERVAKGNNSTATFRLNVENNKISNIVQLQISLPIIDIKDKMILKDNIDVSKSNSKSLYGIERINHCEKVPIAIRENSLLCFKCNMQFSSLQALQSHNQDKHIVKIELEKLTCQMCLKVFKSTNSLKRHSLARKCLKKSSLSEGSSFKCQSCSYRGKTKALLNIHEKTRHNPLRKTHVCDKCDFTCLQERTMTFHKRRHDGEGKFACDQCGKLFVSMSILKRHVNTHSKAKPYICPVPGCGQTFTIKSRLGDHIRTVKHRNILKKCGDESGLSISCSTKINFDPNPVFRKTRTQDVYVYDIILPDRGLSTDKVIENFNCNPQYGDCQTPSKQMSSPLEAGGLDREESKIFEAGEYKFISQKQKSKKSFMCKWEGCGKKFRDNYNLSLHTCTHTGEMQRACPHCRYRCVQKSAMDAHLLTHLRGKRKMY